MTFSVKFVCICFYYPSTDYCPWLWTDDENYYYIPGVPNVWIGMNRVTCTLRIICVIVLKVITAPDYVRTIEIQYDLFRKNKLTGSKSWHLLYSLYYRSCKKRDSFWKFWDIFLFIFVFLILFTASKRVTNKPSHDINHLEVELPLLKNM